MGSLFRFLQYGLAISSVTDKLRQGWLWICLSLDGIVYSFINFLFKLFLILAGTNIFTEDTMVDFMRRIYQLIGVIMLFMLSYALLKKVVSPDSKDKESPSKLVFNVVKAIVLLAIVPSIFTYAFKIQDAILKQNTIGKIIVGNNSVSVNGQNKTPDQIINDGGIMMAQGVFEAFFFPTDGDVNTEVAGNQTYKDISNDVANTGDFQTYKVAVEAVDDGKITYYWGIALLAGAVVVYMLVSYCISLGFRIIKLAFYEIMAPVCIIASIIPSQKEMLSRWIKTTLQVFLETFIRIAILYFVIYLLTILKREMAAGSIFANTEGILKGLCWVAIILGLVTFMKSAPDLISKLTGIDSGNMSLGLKDQLAKGGFFTAGAIGGAMLGGGLRNLVSGGARAVSTWKQGNKNYKDRMKNAENDEQRKAAKRARNKARVRAIGRGLSSPFSAIGGAASGALHSGANEAKDFKTMKEARDKGIKYAADKHDARGAYNYSHGGFIRGIKGHAVDWAEKNIAKYMGLNDPESERSRLAVLEEVQGANDELGNQSENVLRTAMNKNKKITFGLNADSLSGFYTDFESKLSEAARHAMLSLNNDTDTNLEKFGLSKVDGKVTLRTAADMKNFENYVQQKKLEHDPNAIGLEEAFNTAFKSYSKSIASQGMLGKKSYDELQKRLTFAAQGLKADGATPLVDLTGLEGEALENAKANLKLQMDDAKDSLISLGNITVAGTKLRGAMTRGLGLDAMQDSGVTFDFVKKDQDIDMKSDVFKKMEDELKIAQAKSKVKLAKMNESEKTKGDDSKK